MQTHVKQSGGVVSIAISGGVTREDALALWKTLEVDHAHARFGLVRIGSVQWNLSSNEIVELASRVHGMAQISWGFLAGDDHSFGMLRMFVTWAADPQQRLQVFRDEASARAWLKNCGCESPVI